MLKLYKEQATSIVYMGLLRFYQDRNCLSVLCNISTNQSTYRCTKSAVTFKVPELHSSYWYYCIGICTGYKNTLQTGW